MKMKKKKLINWVFMYTRICLAISLFSIVFILTSCGKEEVVDFEKELDLILEDARLVNNIFSISISKDGEITSENYYRYTSEVQAHNVFSVTKSITSLLVGIAIDQGYIDSVNQSIGDYIDLSIYNNSEELETITIKNLLTMSAGFYWDSDDLSSEMFNLRTSSDTLGLILERAVIFTPGTEFNYSDGAAHLVSHILFEATGMSTYDFAVENLFTPLGIEGTSWTADSQGVNIGGCDLYLSSRHQMLIGNLILNKGMFGDVRIVSEDWIEESTTNQVGSFASHGYGYYWWLSNIGDVEIISARGYGGQLIYIVPELNLVITSLLNAWDDTTEHIQYDSIEYLIVEELIPLYISVYLD